MVAMVGLTLLRYSHNLDDCHNKQEWEQGFWIFLLATTVLLREGFKNTFKLHNSP